MTNKKERSYKLYQWGTYAPTVRLQQLRLGDVEPTMSEIQELYRWYKSGCKEAGTQGTMVEFGAWLVGYADTQRLGYTESPPADVMW